jgi:hypothetical protein
MQGTPVLQAASRHGQEPGNPGAGEVDNFIKFVIIYEKIYCHDAHKGI